MRNRLIYKGKVNGFDTVLKYSFDNNNMYIEGKIGDSKINLESDENNKISGAINGKKFNINFESDVEKMFKKTIFGEKLNKPPKYVSFIGEFDNKPFEIKIPGAKIPNDTDTKNLLALLLDFSGMCPEVYQNKMVGVSWKNKLLEVEGEIRDKHEKNKKDNMDTLIKPLLLALVTSVLTTLLGKLDKSK